MGDGGGRDSPFETVANSYLGIYEEMQAGATLCSKPSPRIPAGAEAWPRLSVRSPAEMKRLKRWCLGEGESAFRLCRIAFSSFQRGSVEKPESRTAATQGEADGRSASRAKKTHTIGEPKCHLIHLSSIYIYIYIIKEGALPLKRMAHVISVFSGERMMKHQESQASTAENSEAEGVLLLRHAVHVTSIISGETKDGI
ncbi:hypothetical protein AXF42_Ash007785 [Apostasia shenzhenica]|uniref:Uncharacterized protein n=1 Tax=Apostasia shenzhenica TaxID=1088818 RepID=A0A2I0B5B4_9ASPA|nr:hypothetical protein AXF42_Ash007785 [Apostasia shenzhenica]